MNTPSMLTVPVLRKIAVPDRWCVHGYYTLCPYAPDGSGRLLLAGADVASRQTEVLVIGDADDAPVVQRFAVDALPDSFWHTGLWQSWGPNARCVYYQSGSLQHPQVTRRNLETGAVTTVDEDLEGVPPSGEPGISASHGMLYAAGYSHKQYKPEQSPVPFQARDRHGLSQISFDPPCHELVLSTEQVLAMHPQRDRLLEADRQMRERLGEGEGLTLMCYCVRWNRQGTRLLFYFGNHCVAKSRNEPRIAYVFTADRDLKDLRFCVDLSFDRRGVHWGWHPDGEHLLGYGPDPATGQTCIAIVHHSGEHYRKLASHQSHGHPNVSPADDDLLVTDSNGKGLVEFIDLRDDRIVATATLPRSEPNPAPGRHPGVLDLHPVFRPDGKRVLVNTWMDGRGTPAELEPPQLA